MPILANSPLDWPGILLYHYWPSLLLPFLLECSLTCQKEREKVAEKMTAVLLKPLETSKPTISNKKVLWQIMSGGIPRIAHIAFFTHKTGNDLKHRCSDWRKDTKISQDRNPSPSFPFMEVKSFSSGTEWGEALGFDFYDIGSVAIEKNFLHLHKLARPSARSYWSFDRGNKAFNHQAGVNILAYGLKFTTCAPTNFFVCGPISKI